MKRRPLVVTGVLALFGLLLLGYAVGVEPGRLLVVQYEVQPPRWPRELDGFRLALLSDLHTGSPRNGRGKLERIVEETNAAAPDLVLLLGDYVVTGVPGGDFTPPDAIAGALRGLRAKRGVFAVLGNHDRWLDAELVEEAFAAADIPMLEDRAAPVPRFGGPPLWVAGISDFMTAPHDVRRALSRVPEDAVVLAFTHNPDVFPDVPHRVALTVAGHTHGGQVDVPLLGPPIVPSRYGTRYARGLVEEDGRLLFVTVGLGTSILPVRFRVPPEISILTLRAGA